ncbi:MAG: hypothetical protein U1E76_00040 [Planctomycetota bacterium]
MTRLWASAPLAPAPGSMSALIILLWIALLAGFMQPIANNDIGFHLRLGEEIARTASIPCADTYSFTAAGRPYLDHEWLAQLLLHLAHRHGGTAALIVATSACITLTFMTLLWTLRRDRVSAILLVLLLAPLAVSHAQARPHVLAWLLLALLVAALESGRRSPVIAMLVIWANCHASFLLGVGLATFALVERFLATGDRRLLAWVGAAVLAPLVNPHGIGAFTYFFHIHPSTEFIGEWRAFEPSSGYFWCWLAYVLLLACGLIRARSPALDWLRAVALVALGFSAMRHAIIAGIALAPLQQRVWSATVRALTTRHPRTVMAALATFITGGFGTLVLGRDALEFRVDHEALPVYATEFLLRQPIAGPIFNDYDFGGYLIWKAYPRHRVFIDGRVDVYVGQPLDDYLTVSRVQPGWQAVLARYGIECVLVRADRDIGRVLANDLQWEMVYFDYNSVIYVRKGTSPQVRRIRFTTPWRHRDGSKVPDLIEEIGYLLEQNPRFFGGHKILAALYHRAGDQNRARSEMNRYLELHPSGRRDAETRQMLARLGMR